MCILSEKAFPTFHQKDREQLALQRFLNLLENPEIALSVRQSRPKKIEDAVERALEMESYVSLLPTAQVEGKSDGLVDSNQGYVSNSSLLVEKITLLTDQVEQLKLTISKLKAHSDSMIRRESKVKPVQRNLVVCKKCGREGHFSRGCALSRGGLSRANCEAEPIEIKTTPIQSFTDDQDNTQQFNLVCESIKQPPMCGSVCNNGARVDLLAVNPASAYHVLGLVNGVSMCFMLDTGASVSLVRDDIWRKVAGENATLAKCDLRLVGVEGSAIEILGVATLDERYSQM